MIKQTPAPAPETGWTADGLDRIACEVKRKLCPGTIIDLGSHPAGSVGPFRNLGIDACGLPPFRDRDRAECPPGRGPQGRYDLAVCLDKAALCLQPEAAERFVRDATACSDSVLLSCTPAAFPGTPTLPPVPRDVWLSLFEEAGYAPDLSFSSALSPDAALLFRKRKHRDRRFERPVHILVLSPDIQHACGEIRLIRPLSCLEKRGLVRLRLFPADRSYEHTLEEHLPWADLVVLQKIRSNRWKPFVRKARRRGVPVIYEIDDNLLELPRSHPEFTSGPGMRLRRRRYAWFLQNADAVTTSTLELGAYLTSFPAPVFLLRNYVDRAAFQHAARGDGPESGTLKRPLTVGYAGTFTHRSDFVEPVKALKRISRAFGEDRVRLHFLGYVPWELANEPNFSCDGRVLPYEYYLREIGTRRFDLALAPLEPNVFNQCKSNMKFLEYSFLGIPGLYSRETPYASSLLDGVTGLLVEPNREEAWVERLSAVLEDPAPLAGLRARAREFVTRFFLLDDHFMEWWDTYMNILCHRSGNGGPSLLR